MSVIQKIRDKYAGFVIAFIALSLIAFILMDAFTGRGRAGGGWFSNRSTVGRVNGHKVDKRDFDKTIDFFKKLNSRGGVSDLQMVNQVWDYTVDKQLMDEEYANVGLAFSNKELNSTLFGDNPPMWMRQNFTDPNTGQYDKAKAVEYFSKAKSRKNDPEVSFVYDYYVQLQTVDQTLRQKYMSLLSNSSYVPKWLAEKQVNEAKAISSISYVYVPYNTVSDSTVKVTDEDIKAYVKKNQAVYHVDEASRNVSYVSFDFAPTAEDTQTVKNQVMQLKNEFATSTDDKAFLDRVGTDFPFLNSYLAGSRIQHGYKDSIIKAGTGVVYGPYQDGKEIVLAKLIGVKNLPDSAKVRHILIKTDVRDDSTAKKLADSIQLAVARGANFDSMVAKFSEDQGSKAKGGVYDFFPQGQMVEEFNDFAFEKPVGTKGVVKTQFGYHYVEVLGQKNFQPSYKIAYLAKAVAPSPATQDAVMAEAQKFAASSRTQKAFEENVSKSKLTSFQSQDIHDYDNMIPGLGDNRSFVKWVYENDLGDVSDPTVFSDKVVVAYISNIQDKGLMNVAKAKLAGVEMFVRNEKKAQQIIANKFKGSSLEQYAQSTGSPITRADSLSFTSSLLPGVGSESKVLGVAFNKNQVNKVTEPIAGTMGVFAVRVEVIGAKSTGGNVDEQQKNMESQLKNYSYNATNAFKKAAKIKDYRFDFF